MEMIDYSVIIRTTGNAHMKYRKLLDSISRLVPKPKEVIVVLPEGYELPEERLGWEKFIFCQKGMVRQRLVGINACKTRYALICDDDIAFSSDFVKKLHAPIARGRGFISVAPLYSFLPDKGKSAFFSAIVASAVPTLIHRHNRYISVLKTTGYSYNRHLKCSPNRYYETQSAAWTCFYTDIQILKDINLDQEMWLDAHGYSAYDDQTMFYKAWLMGFKTIVVPDAEYSHLDAKTSIFNNNSSVLYSTNFNRVVFWHRFIYAQQAHAFGRFMSQMAFLYRLLCIAILNIANVFRHRMTRADFLICRKGFYDARKFLTSDVYHKLPPIVSGKQS